MISIKRYLENDVPAATELPVEDDPQILPGLLAAYGAMMLAVGDSTYDACPSSGGGLKQQLCELNSRLSITMSPEQVAEIDRTIQAQLQEWGQGAARYTRERAAEVKELLLSMARTAESVGSRDRRYSSQMGLVTARLERIATLDDVALIRGSVEKGVAELKSSLERMTAEGHAAVEQLRKQVRAYQEKLEDAEEQASRDGLTGLRNRKCVESMIENRVSQGTAFCVGMLDIDSFKKVNDVHGHLAGDELLKMFAAELRSACRSNDVIGRWGGDEFLLIFDCDLHEATVRLSRLCKWVCGDYMVRGKDGALKLHVDASVGLADHRKGEPKNALLARADAAMYEQKANKKSGKGIAVVRAS